MHQHQVCPDWYVSGVAPLYSQTETMCNNLCMSVCYERGFPRGSYALLRWKESPMLNITLAQHCSFTVQFVHKFKASKSGYVTFDVRNNTFFLFINGK